MMGSKLKPEGDLKLLMKPLKGLFNSIAAKAIALLIMFIFAYWVPLKTMAGRWWTDDDYSYGFFIPVVSMYLSWDNRKALKGIFFANAWSVLPFLACPGSLFMGYWVERQYCNAHRPDPRHPLRRVLLWNEHDEAVFPSPRLPDIHGTCARYSGEVSRIVFEKRLDPGGRMDDRALQHPRARERQRHRSRGIVTAVVDACSGMRGLFALLALGVITPTFSKRRRGKEPCQSWRPCP